MTAPAPANPASDLALEQFLDTDQLKRDLAFDSLDMDKGLIEQSGLYFHYAALAVRAKRQHERYKTVLEVCEAQLDSRYREILQKEAEEAATTDAKGVVKVKAVTEAMVQSAIRKDTTWKNVSKRLADAQEIMKLCEAAERTFDQRKDLILQVARNAARSTEGPLRVMANQGAAGARDALLERMKANAGKGEVAA